MGDPVWAAGEYGGDTPWVDDDGDGFSAACDCDDTDAARNSYATEIWANAVDEDCDGVAEDVDGDGYVVEDGDCDDLDAAINLWADETCGDGIDQDCDGKVDEDCDGDRFDAPADCDDADATVHPGAHEVCGDGIDQNCDGTDRPCPEDDDTAVAEDNTAPEPPPAAPAEDEPTGGCGRGGASFVLALLPLAFRRRRPT